MLDRQGFTLMEMIVVLIIIAVAAVFVFPNFTAPSEQARASNAQNNLLAIYSAQQNYRNNNGSFALNIGGSGNPDDPDGIQAINTALALNIQDDATYVYACPSGTPNVCTATRTNPAGGLTITVTLTSPIQLTGEGNPTCTVLNSSNTAWCP